MVGSVRPETTRKGTAIKKPIVILGERRSAVLREACSEVKNAAKENLRGLVADLFDTLDATEDGAGLAAPQIGVARRVFVTDIQDGDGVVHRRVFVNPKLKRNIGEMVAMNEGCLSLPGIRGEIARAERVLVEYQDVEMRRHQITADGWFARCILHEMDHLDGTLIIDHFGIPDDAAIRKIRKFLEDEAGKKSMARGAGPSAQ